MRRTLLAVIACSALVHAQAPAPPPVQGKAAAPIDLTGYWVSIVSEDWRYRMVTPTKGDYQAVPMTPEAVKVADSWDPAADTTAGNQCKSYGAPAIMRVPGRLHITWDDDKTLKVEMDAGTQVRVLGFDNKSTSAKAEPSWQGTSVAQWEMQNAGRGAGPNAPKRGALKVVTTNLKGGYLRKNGVPYSENATLTEYFDVVKTRGVDVLLMVTSIVDDAKYLRQPFIVTSQFKKQADGKGWDPTPCSATW